MVVFSLMNFHVGVGMKMYDLNQKKLGFYFQKLYNHLNIKTHIHQPSYALKYAITGT